ncbi:hypothetical protein C8J56DRAFT_1063950 [Mycena floridula]|nr:hypothetical protein C8J56DRAFT_1063950 [Mycena floridula]
MSNNVKVGVQMRSGLRTYFWKKGVSRDLFEQLDFDIGRRGLLYRQDCAIYLGGNQTRAMPKQFAGSRPLPSACFLPRPVHHCELDLLYVCSTSTLAFAARIEATITMGPVEIKINRLSSMLTVETKVKQLRPRPKPATRAAAPKKVYEDSHSGRTAWIAANSGGYISAAADNRLDAYLGDVMSHFLRDFPHQRPHEPDAGLYEYQLIAVFLRCAMYLIYGSQMTKKGVSKENVQKAASKFKYKPGAPHIWSARCPNPN